jgi:hypothetical protein
LRKKVQDLELNVDLEAEMKKVSIEELRKTQYNNQEFGETITDLVKNWESMRKFAKNR